jgi:hypothetical protein
MRYVLLAAAVVLCLAPAFALASDDGPVAEWRFDTAASPVADRSGHGHAAQLFSGRTVVEDGKTLLALGSQKGIIVPSSPEFNLQPGFTIVVRLKLTNLANAHMLVLKDRQYQLRLDPPAEGSHVTFFPFVDGGWEPRVSSPPLMTGTWYHLAATWDGQQSVLWVNGTPYSWRRVGKPPEPNDAPLQIAVPPPQGGADGVIEYVKIYRRPLSPREIICQAFEITPEPGSNAANTDFDFTAGAGLGDWTTQSGATAAVADRQLVIRTATPDALLLNRRLDADIDQKELVTLRMAADKGSQARLLFVTTKGADVIPFQTFADGKPHTYVFEVWTRGGWGGKLQALGLIPSELVGSTARIDRLRVSRELPVDAELEIDRIFSGSTLPRAGRPERIIARVRNTAGPARHLTATLSVPPGVSLRSPAAQTIAALGYRASTDVTWDVAAEQPVTGPFRVSLSGENQPAPIAAAQTLTFNPRLQIEPADYVPVPVPAKTKYTLWTHYCPLWKTGTHMGWKQIEPWPERQPVLGWYNEGTPEVADWHIKHMLEHGISGIIYCWYRANNSGPVVQQLGHAIHDGLLKARYLSMIRFGLMWENAGTGISSADDLVDNLLPFWIDNYFSHPSYARIDGKPVLYVYVPEKLTEQLGGSQEVRQTFARMRAQCQRRGLGGLYLVGCVIDESRLGVLKAMREEGWDATSSYVNGWHQPAHVTTVGDFIGAPFEGFIDQQQALWKFKHQTHLLPDILDITMGWDSRPWRETPFFWSDNTPEKFRELCRRAKAQMDASPDAGPEKNTAIFCCWNEFGEGHYIEPTRGYGFSYLDVIRETFCDDPPQHVDIGPEDVGRGPLDSWYRKARQRLAATGGDRLRATSWSGDQLTAWSGMMGLKSVAVRDGVLQATTATNDPAFVSPAIEVRANRYQKVVIEMRVNKAATAQLFWTTATMPSTTGEASVALTTAADGQWHSYAFPVGTNSHWDGCVTSLRFDPTTEEGLQVEIRSIRLE